MVLPYDVCYRSRIAPGAACADLPADEAKGERDEVNERDLRDWFASSADVIIKEYPLSEGDASNKILLMYCDGMINKDHIEQRVLPNLQNIISHHREGNMSTFALPTLLQMHEMTGPDVMETMSVNLYAGFLIIYFEEQQRFFGLDLSNPPNRSPEESNTETSIKGPRDGFTESIITNIALIRKRLLTRSLCCEKMEIGKRSHTSIALMYIDDVIDSDLLQDARRRLQEIDIDAVISSAQLEELLSGQKYNFFPLLDYAGRPDYVADSLLRGRFVILCDGSPMALIAPANLMYILKSPEDVHTPFYYVAFERVLRLGGLIVATLLPGFWISLSAFNIDQIPFSLVATISSSRLGLPLSGPMDFIIMLLLFELFREAGARLPKVVGQTVTVVGGLIVGDAAIRSGITSPTTLVITSISTIAMYTLVNQTLAGIVTILRVIILLESTVFGIYGFMVSLIGLVLYMSTLESFGVPYLSPLSPPRFREMITAIFAKPFSSMKSRPKMLSPKDDTRQSEDPQ
ncbi:spore germination protein [Paenibacillus sp. CGMCC 1.16610]|uniref:Spore germination protein n=1 Tax=Paenibacillus anseongense TaxID=2682845 RepID=A0ABW9U0H0_9BACL|nr:MULTISPECIES: spore germination protein [Paenibacillus]MBA2943091.1 spore germination protein [Paenibacillus sp. CGMCC 1.16610]MVQ33587.1 spore germination protein [Paenibacillus anseongense]